MKGNNFLKIISILLIPLFLLALTTVQVKADAGWDTSYGGSSSSSSSSSDYSSSSSSSSSRDYDGYSSSDTDSESDLSPYVFHCIVITVLIVILVSFIINRIVPPSSKIALKDISEDELHKYLPDYSLDQLKKELYDKFLGVQNAWMEFDYDKLKELCTDELYNTYRSQLEVLKLKNGKNIMHDFETKYIEISKIEEDESTICVLVHLNVKFYDYVIDTNTNKVIRGTNKKCVNNEYYLLFTKNKFATNEDICPKCGAKLNDPSQTKCDYCHSEIIRTSNSFVLSKKNIL